MFPAPPQKPLPPDKTVEREVVHKTIKFTDYYNNDTPPTIADFLLSLEVEDPKEFEHIKVQILWDEPNFPHPAIPKGIIGTYSKYEDALDPFYESKYREYQDELKDYYQAMIEYRNEIAQLEQPEFLYYQARKLEIRNKVEEINKEITKLEYEGLGA